MFRALLAFACLALNLSVVQAQGISPQERARVESIIRDYLLKNPEILQEVMAELEKKQATAQEEARKSILIEQRDALFRPANEIVLGNPNGDITLVEFFDYNCGYCKRALSDLGEMIKSDSKLRVVLLDYPVLGPGSVEASQVAVAAKMQLTPAKFFDFHTRLLMGRGQANKARALEVAREVGLDMARLEKDMADPKVQQTIREIAMMGEKLKITGTPSYVVGTDVVEGAVGAAALRQAIAQARESCKKAAMSC